MNALARAFKTDVTSLTRTSQQFSQVLSSAMGKETVAFDQSQNFAQEVNTSTNVRGLIGVQTNVYQAPDNTVYVNARMNRRECAVRYSGMIRENTTVIDALLTVAEKGELPPATFEAYAALSFAHVVAEVTDNFQNIFEVLDPSAANRRPNYGGADAIKTKLLACAAAITVGIEVAAEQDTTLFTRAFGSFFRDRGFKINERGTGPYVLRANVRFEELSQRLISCRYYIDAVLENADGAALFSFTEDDRKSHPTIVSEARRLAVRAVETSIKQGMFAQEFDAWLNALVD